MCNRILHKLVLFVQNLIFVRLTKLKSRTFLSLVCDNKRTFAADFSKYC